MTTVACFCGHTYTALYGPTICPLCLTPVDTEDPHPSDRTATVPKSASGEPDPSHEGR
jgi:hypothetical protein